MGKHVEDLIKSIQNQRIQTETKLYEMWSKDPKGEPVRCPCYAKSGVDNPDVPESECNKCNVLYCQKNPNYSSFLNAEEKDRVDRVLRGDEPSIVYTYGSPKKKKWWEEWNESEGKTWTPL
jgi:hypothetical protein